MRNQIASRLARVLAAQGQSAGQWSQARQLSTQAPLPAHKDGKVLHPELLNENMRKTQYAVRGELYLKAEQLKNAGKEIIFTNGGCWVDRRAPARPRPRTYYLSRAARAAAQCLRRTHLLGPAPPRSAPSDGPPLASAAASPHIHPRPIPPAVGNPHNLGAQPLTFTRQVRLSGESKRFGSLLV
jgi:hypothetical protein